MYILLKVKQNQYTGHTHFPRKSTSNFTIYNIYLLFTVLMEKKSKELFYSFFTYMHASIFFLSANNYQFNRKVDIANEQIKRSGRKVPTP